MPAVVVEKWLHSGLNAIIFRVSLKPAEHSLLKGKPLSSCKRQAEAFFLIDDSGNWWILKKFHNPRNLDYRYLTKVASLLPKHEGLACGNERYILSRGSLRKTLGCHYSRKLDYWLDGTVLMPRTNGIDWAALADEIRDGTMQLSELQRLSLCRKLTKLVELLEANLCCHRDLSCGNVFIDHHTWEVYLIDFDSLYHPSLRIPKATTCGTAGYIPHLAWNNGKLDARRSWCQHVDRFALALLNTEFLLVRPGFKITDEGGIFDQDELRKQGGKGINSVMRTLKSKYPYAAQLLDAAIHSSSFSDCPSPHDWNSFYNTVPGLIFKPPSPSDISRVTPEDLAKKLARCKPAMPPWPAPSLDEMTSKTRCTPRTRRSQRSYFDFLSNQWKKVNGIWRIES